MGPGSNLYLNRGSSEARKQMEIHHLDLSFLICLKSHILSCTSIFLPRGWAVSHECDSETKGSNLPLPPPPPPDPQPDRPTVASLSLHPLSTTPPLTCLTASLPIAWRLVQQVGEGGPTAGREGRDIFACCLRERWESRRAPGGERSDARRDGWMA